MAQIIAHKCISCGAPLTNAKSGKATCPYCGTINYLELEKRNGDEIVCPDCGALNPKDALHCSGCGMKFTFACPKCGATNTTGALFCVKCGVNIDDEFLRRKNAEAQRAMQLTLAQQKKAKKTKKTVAALLIVFAVVICLTLTIVYQSNFSPKAYANQTATQAQGIVLTQSMLDSMGAQYPYHFTSDKVNIYVTQVCYLWNNSYSQWVLQVKYDYLTSYLNSPEYDHSYVIDNLGNRYETGYSTDNNGSGKIQFQPFNKDATTATLYFSYSSSGEVTYPVEIDLTDPLIQTGCAK